MDYFLTKIVSWVVFSGTVVFGSMFSTNEYLTVKRELEANRSSNEENSNPTTKPN